MILIGVGIQTYGISLPFLNASSARGYYAFFWGILIAKYTRNHSVGKMQICISLICIIGIVALIVEQNPSVAMSINYIMTFIFYPAVILVFRTSLLQKIFSFKGIGLIGKIAFDVYIWHNPFYLLMYILIKVFNWTVDFSLYKNMFIYTAVCFAFGAVSHFGIEKPLNRLITEKISKIQSK